MEYIYIDKDGNQTKFTDEMVKVAIDERNELREKLEQAESARNRHWETIVDIRSKVYDFFNEDYTPGDEDFGPVSYRECNELLESIGADTLKRLWTVHLRVDVTISDVEADSEDDAGDIAMNGLEVNHDVYTLESFDADVRSVEEQ